MDIKIIHSHEEYARAMADFAALMTCNPPIGSAEDNALELLALVIENYERKIVPAVIPDPIEAILFRMDQMQLSRKDLQPYIGSLSKISEVLSRKRPLSLSMIRRLHAGLGIPAEVLIRTTNASSGQVWMNRLLGNIDQPSAAVMAQYDNKINHIPP